MLIQKKKCRKDNCINTVSIMHLKDQENILSHLLPDDASSCTRRHLGTQPVEGLTRAGSGHTLFSVPTPSFTQHLDIGRHI